MATTERPEDTQRTMAAGRPAPGSAATLRPGEDVLEYLKEYARERPEVAALWCFGIGFILGWKLKPW